jgi:hypothetical protein
MQRFLTLFQNINRQLPYRRLLLFLLSNLHLLLFLLLHSSSFNVDPALLHNYVEQLVRNIDCFFNVFSFEMTGHAHIIESHFSHLALR